MKCQILFSGKNKKNNIILSSAENAQRVVKVNRGILPRFQNLDQLRISIFTSSIPQSTEVLMWLEKSVVLPVYLISLSPVDKFLSLN